MISKEEFIVIHTLKEQGCSIREIARRMGMDRRTVSKRLKEGELQPYKKRVYPSKLDEYKKYIDQRVINALPEEYQLP